MNIYLKNHELELRLKSYEDYFRALGRRFRDLQAENERLQTEIDHLHHQKNSNYEYILRLENDLAMNQENPYAHSSPQ